MVVKSVLRVLNRLGSRQGEPESIKIVAVNSSEPCVKLSFGHPANPVSESQVIICYVLSRTLRFNYIIQSPAPEKQFIALSIYPAAPAQQLLSERSVGRLILGRQGDELGKLRFSYRNIEPIGDTVAGTAGERPPASLTDIPLRLRP
jgi:hypothetical protein